MGEEMQFFSNMACKLRIHVIESTNASGSGHPTSCSTLCELFAILYFHPIGLRFFPNDPNNPNNDKLILSKGHAAPLLYAVYAELGLIPLSELSTLRKIDSDLEGHPTPRLKFVDIATGSLGQGLSAGCGMAYSLKYFERKENRVYVVMGDGECAEGSVWEAFSFAAYYQLNNLTAIVDINALGQNKHTMLNDNLSLYSARFRAFGWDVVEINGHDLADVVRGLEAAQQGNKPTVLLAKTVKGKDFLHIENLPNWHGKTLGVHSEEIISHIRSKIKPAVDIQFANFPVILSNDQESTTKFELNCDEGAIAETSTRMAFGKALETLGKYQDIVTLDCDTKNSTMTHFFESSYPERFIECYIAEQNMVGVALGLSKRQKIPFVACFAAFLTRAFDQIRLCALSFANIKFIGSHAGVTVGEDGATQMGLEDLAMFRALPGTLVLYPADGLSTYKAVEMAANFKGISYIRTSRPAVQQIYAAGCKFRLSLNAIFKSDNDEACVVAAGVTLHEAVKARKMLLEIGVMIRVVDLFCVKPIDGEKLRTHVRKAQNKVVTVEDHYKGGGIFEAVTSELGDSGALVYGLYIREIPRSGKAEQLIEMYGICARDIVDKILEILQKDQ